MNRLTRKITETMQPTSALIVYTYDEDYRRNYYLELRSIDKNGLMGAGKPVSTKFIQSLIENFSAETSSVPHGEIPGNLLYADVRKEKYVWHSPPCRKLLYFNNDLNIPNGEYYLPGLVWILNKSALTMFAYRAKRLTPNARLYSAPFFNVNTGNGSVCLGNTKLELPEEMTFRQFIKYWEDKFFLSEFTQILGSNPTQNNLVLVIKNSVTRFDNDELLPVNKLKLKDLL
jgi:PRTRC genetic system protein B